MTSLDETIAFLDEVQKRRQKMIENREGPWILLDDLSRQIAELKAERENERVVSQQ